jgi:hypothetical protein
MFSIFYGTPVAHESGFQVDPQKHWNKTLSQISKLLKTNGEQVAIPRDT